MPAQQERQQQESDRELSRANFATVALTKAQVARHDRISRSSHNDEPRSERKEDAEAEGAAQQEDATKTGGVDGEGGWHYAKQPRKTTNDMYAPPLQRVGSKRSKKKSASVERPASDAGSAPASPPARRRNRRAVLVKRQKQSKPMVFGHYSGAEAWHEVLNEFRAGKRRSALYTTVTVLSNTTVALALLSMALVLLEQELTYAASGRCKFFNTSEPPFVTFENPLPVPTPHNELAAAAEVDLQ